MLKKIIPILLALSCLSFAVDAAAILANQQKAAFPDTAEIRMRTTIAMQGLPAQTIESRSLSKGKEKNLTEIKSPLMNMKIIRNGNQLSVTDLKTGATLPSNMAGQADMLDVSQGMGKAGDYLAPVKEGNLWRLSPKDPAQATLLYSAEQKRVVKMRQEIQPGIQSETNIAYCGNTCQLPGTPASIEITTTANGQAAAKITLEILSVQKLAAIPDALFEIF
ncbi:MAG: hypothetical protein LBC85_01910 [Fibromonadaceae bacterium]|jgi:hypothetical protein|nr:hypothetical protein [Fibromonadaceae bacterium]